MSNNIVLIANLDYFLIDNNNGPFTIRNCRPEDARKLGILYFESYNHGQACDDLSTSIADIKDSINGKYGKFWFESSKIIEVDERIIGAILVVYNNSWDNSILCPYIIELFVDKNFRKKGIAKTLLINTINEVKKSEKTKIALTVEKENTPAINLYTTFGFTNYTL